jgi:translation initiation factor IF-1
VGGDKMRVTAENVYFGMVVWVARHNMETDKSKIFWGVVYNIRKDAADFVVPLVKKRQWFKYGEAFTKQEEASEALERFIDEIGESHKLSKEMKPGDFVYVRTPEFYDEYRGDNYVKTRGVVISVGRTRFRWKTEDGKERVVRTGKGKNRCSDTWEHQLDRIIRHTPIVRKNTGEA